MSGELKPCPFCGNAPTLICVVEATDRFEREAMVRCDHCAIAIADEYRSEAIAAWNRRAPESALSAPNSGSEKA